jgi:aspartate/glutamate racemase
MNVSERRTTESGGTFDADLLRAFIAAALGHDAAQNAVNELIFEHVVTGRYHPSLVAELLRPIIDEILEAAAREDWQAVADRLIGEARELEAEAGAKPWGPLVRLRAVAMSLCRLLPPQTRLGSQRRTRTRRSRRST